MSSNVPTRNARLTCATRRSYQSMNHMIRNASSVLARCRRFTQSLTFNSRAKGFTAQILGIRNAVLTSTYANEFDTAGTLQARALKGAQRGLRKQRARGVAAVIGISMSLPLQVADGGSQRPIQSIRQLADKQLTETQESCHNSIVYRESRFKKDAVNGSHHGYYQGRSKYLKDSPDDVQFYWYWHYVANRYGVTRYDEPDYCKAWHHLRVKGWQ